MTKTRQARKHNSLPAGYMTGRKGHTVYDYKQAMKADIIEYLNTTYERDPVMLFDDLLDEDSITGYNTCNYTHDKKMAMEYVTDNLDLLSVALHEKEYSDTQIADMFLRGEWELLDAEIRWFLLWDVMNDALNDIKPENRMWWECLFQGCTDNK